MLARLRTLSFIRDSEPFYVGLHFFQILHNLVANIVPHITLIGNNYSNAEDTNDTREKATLIEFFRIA